ncbi:MAG: hypothetical protein POELPBGB_04050 [Bacteroidia bacterium]|nr:hypothetical protein [Bacteroidia bacterium]
MKFDTHFCLVSEQPTPNLTPVLDRDFRPGRVVLAVTPKMQDHARWLAEVIRPHGVAVDQIPIPDPYQYHACRDAMLDWLCAHEAENVALNITGGTKLMALAAHEVFLGNQRPAFYVSAETDELIFLAPELRDQGFVLAPKLKLSDYLKAHGYILSRPAAKPGIPARLRDLADHVVSGVSRWAGALGQLNQLGDEAERKRSLSVKMSPDQTDSRALEELLGEFEQAGLLTVAKNEIRFADEKARAFVKGGWLEFHTYRNVSDLAPELGITDYAMDIEVVAPDGKTKNQLDGAFLHRNRLHVIECKAGNLATAGGPDASKGADALYKLDSLRRLGGLRTREMLIDYRGKLSRADRERAAQAKIRVVSDARLRDLKGELRQWVSE